MRSALFWKVSFALSLCLLTSCQRTRRNVLIITIDTLRADHLGCYGYTPAHTPAIDRVAAEGVLFAHARSAAPITMPAHTSIFTGLYPPAHGVRDNGAYALGEGATTLAERLKAAGYTTHAFVSALVLNRRYNLNQGFETYDDDLWAEDDPKMFMIRERRAPKTAERFLTWFDQWKVKKEKPFFTWVHFFDPHQPYRPDMSDRLVAPMPYDAEIMGVDRQIGRMVEALRAAHALDDTLLIITADHGESLGEHGESTHAIFVYDATVHVPLIMRAPWLVKPHTYDAPARSVDITPTVLDALGIDANGPFDGRSLLAAIRGKEAAPELPQYSESLLSEVGFGMAPLHAISDGGYKFIRAPRAELYDLRKDPNELHNLFAAQPRLAAKMDRELTELMAGSASHSVKAAPNPMSRETEESLQALGYLAPRGERTSMQGIDPKDGVPLHNMLEDARHAAQAQHWDEAKRLTAQVIAKTPRNVSAINVLAMISLRSGNFDEALQHYRESLAVDPDQFRVYGVLGAIAMTRGEYDEAKKLFVRSLQINPYFAEAMANVGFIETMQGNEKAAEEWYRKGLAADPTFPRVHRRLGDLYFERGDFAKAYDYYQQTIRILPSDARAIVQAANSARRLGKMREADALLQRAQQLRPQSWVPPYNRACLLATNGDAAGALRVLRDVTATHNLPLDLVERDPDLAAVRKLPGYAAFRRTLADGTEEVDMAEDAD